MILHAPWMGPEVAAVARTEVCTRTDHPLLPKGGCVCGKIKT
jgi:hypothetical protein